MKKKFNRGNWRKYHSPNLFKKLAISLFYRKLNKIFPFENNQGLRILDAGCGEGFTIRYFKRNYPKIKFVGLDLNKGVLEHAKTQLKNQARLVQASIYKIPF
ncbi:unnamed protein product, partial [marine sediment metagenome]